MAAGRTGVAGDTGVEFWTGGDTAGQLLDKTEGLVAFGTGMLPTLALFEAGEPKLEPLEALPADGTLEAEAPINEA